MTESMSCTNGHELFDEDKFCGECGTYSASALLLPCRECGVAPNRSVNFCTNCGRQYQPMTTPRVSTTPRIARSFGRNHDVIKRAVSTRKGEVLRTSDILAIVLTIDPSFSPGSLLPNDHAGGNRGACGCSLLKGGSEADPIFERISSGRYLVLGGEANAVDGRNATDILPPTVKPAFEDLFRLDGQSTIYNGVPTTDGLRASGWLRSEGLQAIDKALGRYAATILSGTKGGRYINVGVKLPTIPGLEYLSPHWAIGLDMRKDFVIGQRPTIGALYYGVRCSQNVRGVLGDAAHQALAPVLGGRWERPDQFWAIWKSPTAVAAPGELLSPDEFIGNLLLEFTKGYGAIIGQFGSRT
jgi:hypothetical protein